MTESKLIDKRNTSEKEEYGIAFAARSVEGDYDYQHAFIIWYFSDENAKRTTRRGAGFYPVGGKVYDLLIGGAPGQIENDSKENIAQLITVRINSNIFKEALKVEQKYSSGTYRLGLNDCVTFVEKVASTIPNLSIPNRIINIYPSTFISALFNAN